ncbi:MAG: TRAP transporter large permease subunit [Candidatus Atribacteria bacterium]|nr:TRAP transporter large permease subunit [Candidatus Atribacteria bacterium]
MSIMSITILLFVLLILLLFTGHPLVTVLGGLSFYFGYFFWGKQQACLMIPSKIFGAMNNYTLLAIPLFIFMANLLDKSGIVENLFYSLNKLVGNVKGAIAIVVIIVCTIFAACTGIVGASIITMGLIALPHMLKHGYSKSFSTGVIAAGGSLGILIPPSIMLVVMGDQAGLSVGRLFSTSVIPGLILSVLYIIYIKVAVHVNPNVQHLVDDVEKRNKVYGLKEWIDILVSFLPPFLLIVGVLGSIFLGIATPTEAAGVGCFVAFLLILLYRKFSLKVLNEVLESTAVATGMVMVILAVAGIFTSVFMAMGGANVVTNLFLSIQSKWFVYSLMMIVYFILGMFMDWTGIIYITFPVFLPIAAKLGFDKLWFVTIVAVILQTSFLTPPFGYALFFLKGIAPKEVKMTDIYRGIIPFTILMLIGLIICTVFPEVILYLPSVIFK